MRRYIGVFIGLWLGLVSLCVGWLLWDELKALMLSAAVVIVVATVLAYVGYLAAFLFVALQKALSHRAQRQEAQAMADEARNKAAVMVVEGKEGGVWIRELNPAVQWWAAHLDPRPLKDPTVHVQPEHVAIWSQFHISRRAPAQLAAPAASPANGTLEQWPERVNLSELLNEAPTMRRVVLGVTMGPDGHRHTVHGDMVSMVHVAIGGSSGFGKSKYLQVIGYQVATAPENVHLALIDLERSALLPFAQHPRLFCDMATDEAGASYVLQRLKDEMSYRQDLFAERGVESWLEYNQVAEPLPVIALLADEANDILMDAMAHTEMQTIARRMRKYGMWLILAAQEWKIGEVDSKIRRQLSTKVQFRANDLAQARVLVGREGAQLIHHAPKGRCVVLLPGRGLVQLQAPLISREDIVHSLTTGQPAHPAVPPAVVEVFSDEELKIKSALEQGLTDAQVCFEVWGYKSSNRYPDIDKVRQKMHVQ